MLARCHAGCHVLCHHRWTGVLHLRWRVMDFVGYRLRLRRVRVRLATAPLLRLRRGNTRVRTGAAPAGGISRQARYHLWSVSRTRRLTCPVHGVPIFRALLHRLAQYWRCHMLGVERHHHRVDWTRVVWGEGHRRISVDRWSGHVVMYRAAWRLPRIERGQYVDLAGIHPLNTRGVDRRFPARRFRGLLYPERTRAGPRLRRRRCRAVRRRSRLGRCAIFRCFGLGRSTTACLLARDGGCHPGASALSGRRVRAQTEGSSRFPYRHHETLVRMVALCGAMSANTGLA